jgi:capsular polysaccharide biosynthesis protein
LSEDDCATDDDKRVYISRQSASRGRRVLNFDVLTQILDEYGFEIHKLEEYSFDEQIRLCVGADIIMGPHGAGLLNAIFADDPTMIELFPESVIKPHFYFLSEMLDIEYRSCVTEAEENNLIIDSQAIDNLISEIVK